MKLIVVHYHLRPGGVRRVIELATSQIVRRMKLASVVLAAGEASDNEWLQDFERRLLPASLEVRTLPPFRYISEQRGSALILRQRIRAALRSLFANTVAGECLVWAHNLGLGRNLLLARELVGICKARGFPLIAHQHDWWFENRWQRWPEMRRSGIGTLRVVAEAVFPASGNVVHATVNRADAAILARHFPGRVHWLPNPVEPPKAPPPLARVRVARRWLRDRIGSAAPVWLLPCRLLRRKNLAEALLLTRWLRPEAWLVSTGGVSSVDEAAYAKVLANAAREHGWQMQLGVLAETGHGMPSVAELMAASEAVLFTSIQEGFGLPVLEAAAAGRPLLARRLPNVEHDLAEFGFRFPQLYDELHIAPELFDWTTEFHRQTSIFRAWLHQMPLACRRIPGELPMLATSASPRPIPFSRLTLAAQLEVLEKAPAESWSLCAPLNPFLRTWKKQAGAKRLKVTRWPRAATESLSASTYAARFAEIVPAKSLRAGDSAAAHAGQDEFIRARLNAAHLFPLLW